MDEEQNTLKRLRRSFVSDEAMADRLKQLDPSFGSVDRTTIWRWCNGEKLSRRASLAVSLLSSPVESSSLRVSISSSIVNRPLLLACMAHGTDVTKSPLEERGVKALIQFVATGSESLKLLLNDEADIAIAGKGLIENGGHVRRLCNVGSHVLSGISSNCKILMPSDFRNCEFGFPAGTSIERILRSLLKSRGCQHQLVGVESPVDGMEWLHESRKNRPQGKCLVAYHEWFVSAKEPIKADGKKTFDVPNHLFEEPEYFDLYFNDRNIKPSSIRVLLTCLQDHAQNSRSQRVTFNPPRKSKPDLRILERFEDVSDAMEKDKVRFDITDLDAESLLALWDRDVQLHSETRSFK